MPQTINTNLTSLNAQNSWISCVRLKETHSDAVRRSVRPPV